MFPKVEVAAATQIDFATLFKIEDKNYEFCGPAQIIGYSDLQMNVLSLTGDEFRPKDSPTL